MDAKTQLAHAIVANFHGEDAAKKASDEFRRVFRDRQAPEQAPVRKLPRGEPKKLGALLVELQMSSSRSEAERLIKQGAVEIDSQQIQGRANAGRFVPTRISDSCGEEAIPSRRC